MADWGMYEEMEDYLGKTDDVQIKNKLLRPLYREIKVAVRILSFNEEVNAHQEYVALRDKIDYHYVPAEQAKV